MSGGGSPRSGFLPSRVVHLHATRFCNLACQHCYSDSGPNVRGELDPEPLIAALEILRAEGYEVLSLSGGEPLLYSGFKTITCAAVEAGFQVNLITNGAAVGGKLLEYIGKYVSLVAVSLDGRPEVHNELRGDANAFARAERALDRLSGKDVQFGIAYCVSRESLADMPWAVEFAAEKGAGLVQFHPFAATGRGRLFAQRLNLNESEKARAYVIAALLETDEDPKIQLDLVPVAAAGTRRDDYAALSADDADSLLLSDLVNPLIIDEAGVLLPLCYGINQRLAVGNIGPNLPTSIAEFKEHGRYDLRTLVDTAFDRLGMHGERYTDWFYHLVVTSQLKSSTHPLPVLSES
jgi:pyruvate-formate lyase-activating enzyme